MKKGSNILLLMIVIYLIVAGVLVFLSGKRGTAIIEKEEPQETASLTELVKGDAGTEETAVQNEPAEQPSIIVNEPAPEPVQPAEPEPEPEPTPEPEPAGKKYYSFTASHSSLGLRVRKTPSMKGEILGKILPGTKGFVIEQGTTWSEIVTADGKYRGYSFNEYLDMQEIPAEEYEAGLTAAKVER